MVNVILCGGMGTRLWPISRAQMPKQFTRILSEYSLFQETLIRNNNLTNKFLIICNKDHYFIALNQIKQIKDLLNKDVEIEFILEAIGRNTAASIVFSALHINKDEILFVTPSDHNISKIKKYISCVNKASEYAKKDFITLFGIKPLHAETAYGYIKEKDEDIISFHEKPDLQTAEGFLKTNEYFWNSGMFCFKANVLLENIKEHNLEIFEACYYSYSSSKKQKIITINEELMLDIPAASIDVALIEKCNLLKVVKSTFKWNDLGSYDSIYKSLKKEKTNAIKYKKDKPIIINSKNNLVISKSKTIALLDVDDLIVVDTKDALLITKRDYSQDVKDVVMHLEKEHSKLHIEHSKVYRPWGTYNVMEEKENYKLKTIVVKPEKRLSLQKHLHRNEHWIVLSGTANITIGKKKKILRTNESIYIPMGKKHRLHNKGKIDLIIMEVQVGQYLEEDDIRRYKDDYKRA